ncbi:translation initiation factor IF-2 [Prochlorococcus sp. MIT 1300]|uniref:translation initiation factor IF-2 n=1 Tax=Prochlorococcus sp. MIT 1300 TaxID=3096218 RepID=UPI002A76048F|nr:translation initiation factor IF-2 [Prochlorococcus sp. MIT 1300]
MTISGKIRIYELSRDLGLENKDVLDAANKLSIPVKSHSSSISEDEAKRIKGLLRDNKKAVSTTKPPSSTGKEILSLKKAGSSPTPTKTQTSGSKPSPANQVAAKPTKPKATSPQKPTSPNRPAAADSAKRPSAPSRPVLVQTKTPPKSISPNPVNKAAKTPVNRPAPPKGPKSPNSPKAPIKPSIQQRPTPANRAINNTKSTNFSGNRPPNSPAPRPKIVSKPQSPDASRRNGPPVKNPNLQERSTTKPELVGRPQPKRPTSPPSRPEGGQRPDRKRPGISSRPLGGPNQRNNIPQRSGTSQRPSPPTRPNQSKPGQPRGAGNTLELVGKPIRRDRSSGNQPPRDSSNRSSGGNRQGMPSGMRKPVAPGELMQLQKPTGRPGTPPPRRPDGTTVSPRGGSDGTSPPANRPNPPAAPKRPGHRPGAGPAGAPRRPGKPDWDDSAKLEALRNKSPQKQRQKVHIIGENDDALTTETSGFAGEQQAIVLSASLARPAKPKSKQKGAAKPLAAMRKRKKETTRQRQRRRAMELRAAREAKQVRPEMLIVPEDNLTVQELADMLSVESSEIIKSLFFKGIVATVTQSLDLSTIETVAEEFGVPVLQDDIEEAAKKTAEMIEEADLKHLIRRPPVVTVMGHVDHGKTSLLDAIRKARVAAGEAGGITQHIGAYQVEVEQNGKQRKLTFLDTPGHEAFTAMRARGTKVTDVAVLVVAADDGVRPQTLEAISHARAAEVPIVVAINKIDKEGSSADRVKQELSDQNLLAEEWGGDVVMVPVSAIKGENIDKLLEMILLVTEVEDLQANPNRLAKGTVIEAHLDKAKGPVATLLVQNGTLKTGDVLAAGPVLGKVRAMVDENGTRLKGAGPSYAVEALGFSEVPTAGDEFEVYPDEKAARSVVGERASDARATRLAQQMASRRVSLSAMSGQASEGELKELNIILKADVQGSVEAILGSLEQLPKDEVQVRVLLSAPGEITETDVDLAAASGAVIVGFNTSMASGAKRAADATGVDVRDYEVIYKLLEDIQMAMEGLLEPEMVEEALGEAEVRAIFSVGKSAVAGCYVTTGKLQRNCKVRVQRSNQFVFEGDLDSLRRNKDDVKDVATGFECGIGCDRFANWEEGDIVKAYKLVTQRRKLN